MQPTSIIFAQSSKQFFAITQARSSIGLPARIKSNLKALGFRKRLQTVHLPVCPDIAGKILKVKELVTIKQIDAASLKRMRESTPPDNKGFRVVGRML